MKIRKRLARRFGNVIMLTLIMTMLFSVLSISAAPAGGILVTPVISQVGNRVSLDVNFASGTGFAGIEALTIDIEHPASVRFDWDMGDPNHSFGAGFGSSVGAFIMSVGGEIQVAVDDVAPLGVGRRDGLIVRINFEIEDPATFDLESVLPGFVVNAHNGANAGGSFTVEVNPVTLPQNVEITTTQAQLDTASAAWRVGEAITSFTFTADNAPGGATWSATGLPAGLTLSAAGVLSGTPTVEGTGSMTITAAYDGETDTETFSFNVRPLAVFNVEIDLTSAAEGRQNVTVNVVNGTDSAESGFIVIFKSGAGTGAARPSVIVRPTTVAAGSTLNFNTYQRVESGTQITTWFVPVDSTDLGVLDAALIAGRSATRTS